MIIRYCKIDCLSVVFNMKEILITNNSFLGNQQPWSAMQIEGTDNKVPVTRMRKKMMRIQKVNKI